MKIPSKSSLLRSFKKLITNSLLVIRILIMLILITAWSPSYSDASPLETSQTAVDTELQKQAQSLFIARCSRCHGERGDGRGPFASQLSPPPPNFTSPTWRAQVTPKYLRRAIIGGGRAIQKSLLMPAHPDLRNKRELLNALIQYLLNLAPTTVSSETTPTKTPLITP